MAFTKAIEPSRPADTNEAPSLGASVIRNLKTALIERLTSWVNGFDSAGTESDVGLKHAPFCVATSDPTAEANKAFLYAKDKNSIAEVYARTEDGKVTRITEKGGVAINGEYAEKTALNVYRAVSAGFVFGAKGSITISDDEALTVNAIVIPNEAYSYASISAVILAGKYYSVSGNVGDKYYFVAH